MTSGSVILDKARMDAAAGSVSDVFRGVLRGNGINGDLADAVVSDFESAIVDGFKDLSVPGFYGVRLAFENQIISGLANELISQGLKMAEQEDAYAAAFLKAVFEASAVNICVLARHSGAPGGTRERLKDLLTSTVGRLVDMAYDMPECSVVSKSGTA